MSPFPDELPPLDCHAHIAPDVTPAQIDALHGAVVFAVTRDRPALGTPPERGIKSIADLKATSLLGNVM
ncbi:hypothetical protein [Streptomyces sp. SID12501]|uniref:Uncharacterized protein n=1 Tax=Streptomyces sp. SID12501 TaxID=2706042 RepID=A0A6B3C4T1_9ACTN|nr:hypothetical protein [Streptomyces sp. SID12501]NEC91795.1 hypothetical protein [Streptomyces sp. SID12501]